MNKFDQSVVEVQKYLDNITVPQGTIVAVPRTPIGGYLEQYIQYKAFGHKLKKIIAEAIKNRPNMELVKNQYGRKEVFVHIKG